MTPNGEDPINTVHPKNEADIEEINRKYHRVLKRAAIRRLLPGMSYGAAEVEADGVLQEVYLDAWRKGITGVEETLLQYLLGMVRFKAIDRLRKRRPIYDVLDQTLQAVRIDLQKEFENRDRLERAISRLPPIHKEIISLSYKGYSGEEMATQLCISHGTARARLHRAMEQLRKNLEEDNPES